MPPAKTSPAPPATATAPSTSAPLGTPGANCVLTYNSDGTATVTFKILDPQEVRRLKLRAGRQEISEFLWENILRRAVTTFVY